MTDEEIIAKLHEAFRAGLPRSMPSAPQGELLGRETIIINGGRGQRCSACTEMIGSADEGSIEYYYPTMVVRLHRHCNDLWMVEREKPVRR